MTSLIFDNYAPELKTILKENFLTSPLRQTWSDAETALLTLSAIYNGRFVASELSTDTMALHLNPKNYTCDVIERVKCLYHNYEAIDTSLKYALSRHRLLMNPGHEPKNKALLPKTLTDFFYNRYKEDSYYLHLLFDRFYLGFILK